MEHFDLNLEYDGASEDDVYYTEIKRQILLLTADDDDEEFPGTEQFKYPDGCINHWFKGSSGVFNSAMMQPAGSYFRLWDNENIESSPCWLVNQWKNNGNGTGVFIPHIVKSTMRNKSGRKRKNRRKKQVEDKQL